MSADSAGGIEAYDPNQRLALLCIDDPGRAEAVDGALQALGYRPQVASVAADVLARLRKSRYELAVVDEAFQGAAVHDHPVLQALQAMPMAVRRDMFVVLVSPEVKTLDQLTAFTRSVNVVIRYDDLGQATTILERAIADHDQFYRVFREVLREVGRR